MLDNYHRLQPIPKTIDESKVDLQTIWEELAQVVIGVVCLVMSTNVHFL